MPLSRVIVNHAVGRLNLGTLIVAPREHVVAIADLDDDAVTELGPLLRDAARNRSNLPARADLRLRVVARSGRAAPSAHPQVKIMTTHEPPEPAEIERFCSDAKPRFAAICAR